MWDIEIGKSKHKICSASLIRDIGDGYRISANKESYWISESFLDVGLQIFTGTKEFTLIKDLLTTNETNTKLKAAIDDMVICNVNKKLLRSAINNKMQSEYRRGRMEAKAEIRAVLQGA